MTPDSPPRRLASLDQFRGYTVAGMLLVNFSGGFEAVPAVLKHHNTYCSYADTIMPQFFFAVGYAFRLTHLRRLREFSPRAAAGHAVRRALALALLGWVLYHFDGGVKSWADLKALGWHGFVTTAFVREPFQTLTHIALASLWVLPVIGAGVRTRLAYLAFSGGLHLALSAWFYFSWAWQRPVIDGGPLGFLTWSVPLLAGSLAFDAVSAREQPGRLLGNLLGGAILFGLAGYALSSARGLAALPFRPPDGPVTLWTMSQRTGSLSYQLFGAGVSLAVFALFVAASDLAGWQSRVFRAFGRNALAVYVLHGLIGSALKPYAPDDSPAWYVGLAVGLDIALNYLFAHRLDRDGVYIKL